jgi:hypothetical protein
LFSKNTTDNQIKLPIHWWLSGQTISSIYYSAVFNKTLVGYENGLIVVINEADGAMLKVVDIINKQLPANMKKSESFMNLMVLFMFPVTLVLCLI